MLAPLVLGIAVAAGAGGAVDPAPLVIPPDAPELTVNPALPARLRASAHGYFRGIGARFTTLVCERYAREAAAFPVVTLHGDAHLEQYAVTDHGRGLTDFDDSTRGSALVDLARFATSLTLAARERGFGDGAEAVAAFARGYALALDDPRRVAPEPSLVHDLRAGFTGDPRAARARAEALMTPLPADETPKPAVLQRAAELLAQAANRPASFFQVKKVGLLRIGIGSAADERYLMRIEGPSPAEADDVMLEVKEVRRLPDLPCLQSEPGGTRIIVAQAVLAYEAFSYVGTLALDSPAGPRHYWFHAWPDNYAELRIAALPSAPSLREVAFDVGVQLGRGHGREKRSRDGRRTRDKLKAALGTVDLPALARTLADATEEAWRRFCAQAAAAR